MGPLRASNGLVKCVREFSGEDRGEKSIPQCGGNEGAKSREQRNHDKRFNCRVHVDRDVKFYAAKRPNRLTVDRESVDKSLRWRFLQIDPVRRGRTVPVTDSIASQNPSAPTPAQRAAAQGSKAGGERTSRVERYRICEGAPAPDISPPRDILATDKQEKR